MRSEVTFSCFLLSVIALAVHKVGHNVTNQIGIQCFGTPKVWHFCSLLTFTATSRKSNETRELIVGKKESLNH